MSGLLESSLGEGRTQKVSPPNPGQGEGGAHTRGAKGRLAGPEPPQGTRPCRYPRAPPPLRIQPQAPTTQAPEGQRRPGPHSHVCLALSVCVTGETRGGTRVDVAS